MATAGRKAKFYVTSDNKPIEGLDRKADGRWRVVETGFRFTEPDEQKAIERFYRLTGADDRAAAKAKKWEGNQNPFAPTEEQMFSFVAQQIKARPLYAAKMLGIEQIGYLDKIVAPADLPTLDEIEQLWKDKNNVSDQQASKVTKAWKMFRQLTQIRSIKDITEIVATDYADAIYKEGYAWKEQYNLFNNAKRMLTFTGRDRHIATDAIEAAIKNMRVMEPRGKKPLKVPKPIKLDDWRKLKAACKDHPRDLAVLLVCLNGAYYLGEISELKWENITDDGALIARRDKEGEEIRICVLWKETLAALNALPKINEWIFTTKDKAQLQVGGAHDRFDEIRKRAKIKVTGSQLRDGARYAMAKGNIEQTNANIVMGHSSGMTDAYLLSHPDLVADASKAIYTHYML